MPMFTVKSRTTGPTVISEVDAANRDAAIAQTIASAAEDESIEVMDVKEGTVEDVVGPTGTAGPQRVSATGGSATSNKKTRAELNEMTKEELLDEAEAAGVEVSAHWNKADIVDAIVKHK